MPSLGGRQYAPFDVDRPEPKRRSYGAFIWTAIALLVLGGIVIGIISIRRSLNKGTDAVATLEADPVMPPNSSSPTDSSQAQTMASTTTETGPSSNANKTETRRTPSPQTQAQTTSSPATVQPDPVLFPPDSKVNPEPKQPEQTDYSRVFALREVDVRPQFIDKPKPSYTDAARQNNVQGRVLLRAVLLANGSISNISTVSGLSHGLTEQAIAAARRIKFVPATKDGRQVSVSVTLEYNFSVY